MKTSCKYAVSCCNVNFVTLHLACLWHLFLLHQQECSQLQGLKKKAGKENVTCWVWRVESLIWTTGTKLIFYIFALSCFPATLSIGTLSS